MRSDLPTEVRAAIERCERASLVFDRARIERNLVAFAAAAKAQRITALFAAKSFPHRAVWELAAAHLDGFDVASEGELASVPAARVVSIVDPSGRAGATRGRTIVGCETVAQAQAAPAGVELAIRVSASLTGRDPAVGAVQHGSGHRRSRFGIETREELAAIAAAAGGRPVGLHVHHGPVTATTAERFVATARAVLALAEAADVRPAFVDLGGAWHGIAEIAEALAVVRAAVPAEVELIVEPGRLFTEEAGFACGRVVLVRALADRALGVADVSRICHLRWSQIELVGTAQEHTTLLVGPTCSEDDVLGEWSVRVEPGARVAFRHVSGYAVAWNTGFGGVAPADVILAG